MSHSEKISVVILGNGRSLKKALITTIVGRDLSTLSKRSHLKKTLIYTNDVFEFTLTPDLHKDCEDVRTVLGGKQQPHMCLLVVEEEFPPEDVWQQIKGLSDSTGKPTEELVVVLPLGRAPPQTHQRFRSMTVEQVVSRLRSLDPLHRPAGPPEPHVSAHTQPEVTGRHTGTGPVNLVLLGMAGTGKSACGNTILGKKVFPSRPSSKPVTSECQAAETEINGTRVRVIDTPDLIDEEVESSVRNQHVKRCVQLCGPEPRVYLLLMHVSRFTDGERGVLTKVERAFGSRAREQVVIVLTRADDLYREGISLEDFLTSCQPELKRIVGSCGNRCVLFENGNSAAHGQVEELMLMVNKVLEGKHQE